jgi:long-chain acyl-CoA synthetase
MQLTRLLRRAEQIAGTRTAVIFRERRRTWADYAGRVARLAGAFRRLGLAPDGHVAILMHSSDRYLESLFAALWAGGVFAPLSTRATLDDLARQLADSGARILVVDDDFANHARLLRERVASLHHVIHAGDAAPPPDLLDYEALLMQAETVADAGRRNDDTAALFYTGGTTGQSKGVMLTHTNLYSNAINGTALLRYDDRSIHLHLGPLYHVAAGARVITATLAAATQVVIPRFAAATVLEAVATHGITVFSVVPTMLSMLLRAPELETCDLSSLKLITYGAAPMPEVVIDEAVRRLPLVDFAQAYGMTELSPACTYLEPHHHRDERLRRSAGRAAPGCEIRIVNADDRELPRGAIGEIVVAGPVVMKGYWRQPELTAQALRGGFMHTGDLGIMDDDGFVYVVDRLKDMIVTGGENVYTIEVEDAILTHPAVATCAVIGIPDALWGEAVHAAVVPKDGATLGAEDLIAHCRGRIAAFKCPRSIELRAALPMSGANKILKAELRRPFWEGRPRAQN